jgi:glucose-6-phosphate 1-epimerase
LTDGTIEIVKDGSLPDAVVWNPAEAKASKMADLETEEYKRMVCIEPAAVNESITLSPGEKFRTRLIISKAYNSKL